MVKQGGGHIRVQSQRGVGSVFTIYLPYLPALEVPPAEIAAAPIAESVTGSETILLVEDQPEVRRFTADSLRSFGYTVLESHSTAEAVEIARSYPSLIHLLFTA